MNITYEQMRSNAERIADAQLKERVLAGLAALEAEHGPGWEDLIYPAELHMLDCSYCVLGQVYGSYEVGLEALSPTGKLADSDGVALGFCRAWTDDGPREEWEDLEAAWLLTLTGDPVARS